MSSNVDYNSVEEMTEVFSKKASLIRTSMELKNMDDACARKFLSIEDNVVEVRGIFKEIREEIQTGEDKLIKLQELLKKLENLSQKLDHMKQNLPPAITQTAEKENSSVQANAEKKTAVPVPSKSNKDPEKMQLITVDEFKGVPDYMKGRMKYEQVNKFVSEFNGALQGKYKLLSLPRKEMKPADLKVYQKLKSQESADTKGLYFCTADDLREYGKIKLDKLSSNMLTILRHCRKMKEIRGPGPIVRYTVIA